MSTRYDDIISLPHHVSAKRKQMPVSERAAQFLPFAALTGFGSAIAETGRLTEARMELDEYEMAALSDKLTAIQNDIENRPYASITYFQPDAKKEGGAYLTVSGRIKKIDELERCVAFENGVKIPIDDIVGIGGGRQG